MLKKLARSATLKLLAAAAGGGLVPALAMWLVYSRVPAHDPELKWDLLVMAVAIAGTTIVMEAPPGLGIIVRQYVGGPLAIPFFWIGVRWHDRQLRKEELATNYQRGA